MGKTVKKQSRKQLVAKLDAVFSKYIRLSKSQNGIGTCVTCQKQADWKELQNGHFFTRGRYPTRWDEDNCHIQCVGCNVFLKGNYINYTRFMLDSYSRGFVDDLERKSLSSAKISTPDLVDMIQNYTDLVKQYMLLYG